MLGSLSLLRAYAGRRLRRLRHEDAERVQQRQFRNLIRAGRDTQFGRDHGFPTIRHVSDYRRQVPLRRFEDFWRDYWSAAFPVLRDRTWPGLIPYIGMSSGTSAGTTKHIPISHELLRAIRWANRDLLTHHLANRPRSRATDGKFCVLSGSTDLATVAPGVRTGWISGILVREMSSLARRRSFPPAEVARLADWEEKIGQIAGRLLREDVRMISGLPPWLLLLFDRLAQAAGQTEPRLASLLPKLEMVVHSGVNFAPYAPRFRELLEGSRAETREVYLATEGFLAVADRGPGEGLRPILDNGIFFEFVPVEELDRPEPTRHWIAEVETGIDYAVVLTTCAGLWGYVLGDTVRFVGRNPPRLVVTGRVSYYLSPFGEHVTGEQLDVAVTTAAGEIGRGVADYCVGPEFPTRPGEPGRHVFVIEFPQGPAAVGQESARLAACIDRTLGELNEDYLTQRSGGFGLRPPVVQAVPSGTFAAWMKAEGRLGGQPKVRRVLTEEALRRLLAFVDRLSGSERDRRLAG